MYDQYTELQKQNVNKPAINKTVRVDRTVYMRR